MKYKIIIILLLISALFLANYNLNNKKELSYKINDVFPYELNQWKGKDIEPDKSVYTMIDPEELLFRTYEYNDEKIHLSIVLTNRRDHIHDPQVCYRGQGVNMNDGNFVNFGNEINALLIKAKKQKFSYNIIYWYTDLDKTYSSRYEFMKKAIILSALNKPVVFILVSVSGAGISQDELMMFAEEVNNKLFELKIKLTE